MSIRSSTASGWSRSEIDAYAAVRGPGSFTGIRVGLGTIGGLALAADRPCFGIGTLPSLAEAHGPDALERVRRTLRPLVTGRLLVLFGAGGDRDRSKRPLMGEVAARHADLSFVTSDNPRTESPDSIIDEVVAGMGSASLVKIADRIAVLQNGCITETGTHGELMERGGLYSEMYTISAEAYS